MWTVPKELRYFFKGEPKSLIISGDYNSYHREIALSILNEYTHGKNVFYYSFKERDRKYAWMNRKITGKRRFTPKYIDHFTIHHSTEKINELYKFAEKLPENSYLFIDYIDELVLDYKMRHDDVKIEEILYMIQKDIVERGEISTVMVTSHDNPEMRRIADGFIRITVERIHDNNFRVMKTENLKNIHEEKIYLVSFSDRKYYFFSQSSNMEEGHLKISMGKESGECISTGLTDLDHYLGGGLSRGTYNIIEVTNSVPEEVYRLFVYHIALNNLKRRRGVLIAPAESISSDLYYRILSNYMEKENLKYLKILKSTPIVERDSYVVDGYSRTPEDRHEIWKTAMEYLNSITDGPVVDITEFGVIESSFSLDSVVSLMSEGIKWLSEWKDIGIGVISEESEVKNKLMYLAKNYIKIFDYHGLYCIVGIKPKREIRTIYVKNKNGEITVHLKRVI